MKTGEEAHRRDKQRLSIVWVWSIVVFAWACRPATDSPPANLIPEDKMVQVLTDIHLAEAKATKLGIVSNDSTTLIYRQLERQLYKKYGVDTATYNRSYTYYASNPERFAEIYKRVVSGLQQSDSLQRLSKPVVPKDDSLAKAKPTTDSVRRKPSLKKLKDQLKIVK
jgi:hypothetical protein